MAAEVECVVQARVTDLGNEVLVAERFTDSRTPTDKFQGYAVVGSTDWSMDLGAIEDSEVLGIWVKAESGNIYIVPNCSIAAPAVSVAGNYIPEGQAAFFSYASTIGVYSVYGAPIVQGNASTAAISYLVYGATT